MSTRRSADKPHRVVVHRFVDGRDHVIKRLHFATAEEAKVAAAAIEHGPDEQVDIVLPLPFDALGGDLDDAEVHT